MDNSISDVKSTTESNTLNISLNHKQMEQNNNDCKSSVIIFIVNEKITALQALVDELIKRKPVVQNSTGPALDMDMFDGRYAGKNPPDNTIVRIEALEKLTKALQQSQDKNQSDDDKNQIQDDEQDKRIAML